MTEEQIKARRLYYKKYYEKNKNIIKTRQKKWRKENPEKVKEYTDKFFLNQMMRGGTDEFHNN